MAGKRAISDVEPLREWCRLRPAAGRHQHVLRLPQLGAALLTPPFGGRTGVPGTLCLPIDRSTPRPCQPRSVRGERDEIRAGSLMAGAPSINPSRLATAHGHDAMKSNYSEPEALATAHCPLGPSPLPALAIGPSLTLPAQKMWPSHQPRPIAAISLRIRQVPELHDAIVILRHQQFAVRRSDRSGHQHPVGVPLHDGATARGLATTSAPPRTASERSNRQRIYQPSVRTPRAPQEKRLRPEPLPRGRVVLLQHLGRLSLPGGDFI